jgi:signal transduction histidine kinase
MPPGWDGVKTIEHIWKEDPDLQTVICTAYSDYSWEETIEKLGRSDRLLIVKKPFDAIEIRQLASALTRKWSMTRRERTLIEELKRAERESRAYASSLETVNRALMTAKASADRSAQLKTDFLVQLGSQIQTQMQNICGRVALLKNPGALAAAELAHVDRILDASSYLMSVFDNILDLSLIETGKIEIERKPFSVTDVVRSLVSTFRPRAAQKNLDLDVEIRGPLPERIRTHAARFEQVLSELLDNAVRNTEYGSVRVVVRLEQTDDWREPILRLDVIDTGQGITEEHLGRAFEPFYRTPAEAGEHRPGLGLGLSRQLAQLLGGDLVVDTAPGRGSAFTFTLEAGNLEGVPMIE